MLTLRREPRKRLQDAADFTSIVQHSLEEGPQRIDFDRLRELGDKVGPGGGGDELLRLVATVTSGGIVDVNALHRLD
jgi:hypothetical protein